MKVSIISAVRNEETSIHRTLRSVEDQTHTEIEHIVIDGASTDRTVDVVRTHGARVAALISEPDVGVYDAFNKGLARSTGDIIGFLSAGDVYADNNVVQTISDEFEAQNVGAVYGDLAVIDPSDHERVVRHYNSSWFRPATLRYGFMPAHPTLYIRREIYDQFGAYDASFKIAGDFELAARMFVRYDIDYAYHPKVLVRMSAGGLSTSGLRANWIITREMYRACQMNGIQTSYLRLLLRFPVKLASVEFAFLRLLRV